MIINTKADLEALRGTAAYAEALRRILGATTMWVNNAPAAAAPVWQQVSVGDTLAQFDLTVEELLEECAAAGITPQTPQAPTATPAPTVDLSAYAADKRYAAEIGGTTWRGWPVATDDRSQGKILAELAAIDRGERADPDGWKFADGDFRPVSNADFPGLAVAVRSHVRNCFLAEASVLSGIASGTITTKAAIDAAFA